jgi:hypothetical protein
VPTIDPFQVRFSQSTISYRFRDGRTIDDLAEDLRSGRVSPEDVPPVRVSERLGSLYTLDNRRLEAFRRARVDVPYVLATDADVAAEVWKFTTTNEGTSVRVRGQEG